MHYVYVYQEVMICLIHVELTNLFSLTDISETLSCRPIVCSLCVHASMHVLGMFICTRLNVRRPYHLNRISSEPINSRWF